RFFQIIGGKDSYIILWAEARPQAAKIGIHQQGVIDDADQLSALGSTIQEDRHKAAKTIISGLGALYHLIGAVDLADIIDMGVGLDDLADRSTNVWIRHSLYSA